MQDAASPRRVSMRDVAAFAGVSGQTVSRVVNGSPRVDPTTRSRVEAAMAELGYRPHRAARALRTGRTQTLGVVAATLDTVGNARMLQAVVDAAAARDYTVVVVTVGADGGRANGLDTAFTHLRDQGVDGAVILNEATGLLPTADVPAGLRLVVVDAPHADRFDVVQTDHADGARSATAHLLALGHRTVHLVAGPAGSFAAEERRRGWRQALQAAGAPVPEPVVGDWSAASGHAAGAILARDRTVTAVFAANDEMALGVLGACADAGRRVPHDVSVVGFDDVADAAWLRPALTTVHQDFAVLGRQAVDTLVARIAAPSSPVAWATRPTLVVRGSTAPPHETDSAALARRLRS